MGQQQQTTNTCVSQGEELSKKAGQRKYDSGTIMRPEGHSGGRSRI